MTIAHINRSRRGATLVLSAILMVVLLGMVAFGVDTGYIVLVRTQLQASADAAALAAGFHLNDQVLARDKAKEYGNTYKASGRNVQIADADVEFGVWDEGTRTFAPDANIGNAIRVTSRCSTGTGGEAQLFFGRIMGMGSIELKASAVVYAKPRDIALIVDMSGSMNDDTESTWAGGLIDGQFGAGTTSGMMQTLYNDFGFGSYPGPKESIGQRLGVYNAELSYAELSSDSGPLASISVPANYRIEEGMDEYTRKLQVYKYLIEQQIAPLMPNAKPTPSLANYDYWEKYLDYIIQSTYIDEPDPNDPPPPPPDPDDGGGGGGGDGGGGGGGDGGGGGGGDGGGGSGGGPPPPSGSPPGGWLKPGERFKYLAGRSVSPSTLSTRADLLRSLNQQTSTLIANELLTVARRKLPTLKTDSQTGLAGSAFSLVALLQTPGYSYKPPYHRYHLPPNQYGQRITGMNNPNPAAWAGASSSLAAAHRNIIGYETYVQFMLDHGSDRAPSGYTPYSINSPNCVLHTENTAGGSFSFPARAQPEHAARRSLIAALAKIRERNQYIPNPVYRDQVSIIAFDNLDNGDAVVLQPLTYNYTSAMSMCTRLQAVNDVDASTATEAGMIVGYQVIAAPSKGGAGREKVKKVAVVLTDGIPNLYRTPYADIWQYTQDKPSPNFYGNGQYWYEAPLMQSAMMKTEKWEVYPVGLGMATDYNFMDRMARMGGTAKSGQAYRSSGDPNEYEEVLTQIFEEIILRPKMQLVQ